jgi:hypothetical protein
MTDDKSGDGKMVTAYSEVKSLRLGWEQKQNSRAIHRQTLPINLGVYLQNTIKLTNYNCQQSFACELYGDLHL